MLKFAATMQQQIQLSIFPDMFAFPINSPGSNNTASMKRLAKGKYIFHPYL